MEDVRAWLDVDHRALAVEERVGRAVVYSDVDLPLADVVDMSTANEDACRRGGEIGHGPSSEGAPPSSRCRV